MIFIIPMSMLFDILDFLRLRINILIASLGPSIGSHEERVREQFVKPCPFLCRTKMFYFN